MATPQPESYFIPVWSRSAVGDKLRAKDVSHRIGKRSTTPLRQHSHQSQRHRLERGFEHIVVRVYFLTVGLWLLNVFCCNMEINFVISVALSVVMADMCLVNPHAPITSYKNSAAASPEWGVTKRLTSRIVFFISQFSSIQ